MVNILTPVLFIHGMWLHASSWENWMKLFRRKGYVPYAPGWPGEADDVIETRFVPEKLAGISFSQLMLHYREVVERQEVKPIVIGHGLGGLIAQKLLGENLAAAAIALAPVQPRGVLYLSLRQITAAFPAYKNPFITGRAVSLNLDEFRYIFGNALSAEESVELYTRWSIPSPAKALLAAGFANFNPRASTTVHFDNDERGPLLLVAVGRDNAVPPTVVRAQRDLYAKSPAITEIHEFAYSGHSFYIDGNWREVADFVADWLERRLSNE